MLANFHFRTKSVGSALAARGEYIAGLREPCAIKPWCSTCRWVDRRAGGTSVCWRFIDAVSAEPVTCQFARGLGGPCGPLGNEHALGSREITHAVDAAASACVNCRHHVLDQGMVALMTEHLCAAFPWMDGTLPVCHEVRREGGACGLVGSSFEAADYIADGAS